jgi:DNA polymerase III subunit gamma/tau
MAKKAATSPPATLPLAESTSGSIGGAAGGVADSTAAGARTGAYTVLARRYRSRDFGEVVGQEPIARTLQNAIATSRTAHAYLFCGTRGVGKTSMARIFARALNRDIGLAEGDAIGDAILRGEDLDVIEIDGASNRGIDDARDLIAGAGLAPTRGKYRIYIIDEVHMLTTPAFNALLKTMEEPPAHVKFILCTTEPHKVPQTIQSRCQRFDFRNIPTKQIAQHLGAVAAGEKIEVTEEVLLAVARLANGSMRDGLSLLDRLLAASTGRVDATVFEQVFGLPDDEILLDIIEACVEERIGDALRHGARLLERGSGVEQALELLAERFRWILVACATAGARDAADLLEVAQSMRARVERIASSTDAAQAAHAIALCDAAARNARSSSAPRALYDACVARLSLSSRFAAGAALLAGNGGGAHVKKAGDPAARSAVGPTSLRSAADPASSSEVLRVAVEPKFASRQSGSTGTAGAQAATSQQRAPASLPPTGPGSNVAPTVAPTVAPAQDLAELKARLSAIAAKSPRDAALVSQCEVVSFTEGNARVTVRDDGGGQYLAGNPEPLRTLLARAAGRAVRVSVDMCAASDAPGAPRPIAVDDSEVRNDPLVRRAADLFDATIVAVTRRISTTDAADADRADSTGRTTDLLGAMGGSDGEDVREDRLDAPMQ